MKSELTKASDLIDALAFKKKVSRKYYLSTMKQADKQMMYERNSITYHLAQLKAYKRNEKGQRKNALLDYKEIGRILDKESGSVSSIIASVKKAIQDNTNTQYLETINNIKNKLQ